MARLLCLLFCLLAVAGFGQRRAVVRELVVETVQFFPKVAVGGRGGYVFTEDESQKAYTSWANLAERSGQSKRPVSLMLNLDSVSQRSDWASLRNVKQVHSLNISLPPYVAQATLDSLLNALANWPELVRVDIVSVRIDLTKPQLRPTVLAGRGRVELKSVRSANFFGTGNEMVPSLYLLRQCPILNRLTINGFGNGQSTVNLPAELARLHQLRTLHLSSGQGFTGLNSAFAGLTNLTSLYMNNTSDGGKLTTALSHLPNLRRLELRFGFTDTNLNKLRLDKLTQLDSLECHFITGTVFPIDSVLAGVPSLKVLTLENGRLPTLNWLADLPDLTALYLTGCQFPLPVRSLAKLTQLETLSIEQADSLGTFPEAFTTLPNLHDLNLPDAQIGTLPPSIGNLTSLTALNLYHNKLQTLPAELGKLVALKSLNLGNNQLAQLPVTLFGLLRLETLALYDNQLKNLPAELGQLLQLHNLFLSNNQLVTLPDALGRCRNLVSLVLDNNPLTALPDAIGNLDSLQTLNLATTRLRALPGSIGQLTNLRTLTLAGGHLTALPASLGNCRQLTTLVLRDSLLTTLPASFSLLHRLSNLTLALPQLRLLPSAITSLTGLTELTMQMPQLLVLPNELGHLTNLRSLAVSSHKLLGLPSSFGQLKRLASLLVDGGIDPLTNQPLGVLDQLPDSISACLELTHVRIENQLAFDGADAIRKTARLPKLDRLSMIRCGMALLTDIDWKTVGCRGLYLEENNLRNVPEAILTAPNLQVVNLVGNTQLPPKLNQIFTNRDALRQALADMNQQR